MLANLPDRRLRGGRGDSQGPVLLACEKCERRLAKEGRFRQIAQLQGALDAIATEAQATGSGLQILQVPCMDVCPKGAMAVASGADAEDVRLVRTPADLQVVCEELLESAALRESRTRGAVKGMPSNGAPPIQS